MTLNQLRYFTQIVHCKGFTRAAERLHVSQPALSKSIRTLEQEFQAELIDRGSKDFALTNEGVLFQEYAQRMLDYFDAQAKELRQRLHTAGGSLRLGIPPTAGSICFFPVLHRFQTACPNVDLSIYEEGSNNILEMLDAGKLDMGIVLEPFDHDSYYCKQLYLSEVMVAVSSRHPLAHRKVVSGAELRSERFLAMSPDYMFHDLVIDYCRRCGFTPQVVFQSSQWDLIYQLVADDQGIAFFPKPLLEKGYRAQIKCLRLKDPDFPWTLSIIYRRDKFLSEPMRCIWKMCETVD